MNTSEHFTIPFILYLLWGLFGHSRNGSMESKNVYIIQCAHFILLGLSYRPKEI